MAETIGTLVGVMFGVIALLSLFRMFFNMLIREMSHHFYRRR